MERKLRRNKISKSKGEEQKRDGDGGGDTKKQTIKDTRILWRKASCRNRESWRNIKKSNFQRQKQK